MRKDGRKRAIRKIKTHKKRNTAKLSRRRIERIKEANMLMRQKQYALKNFGKSTAKVVEIMSVRDPAGGKLPEKKQVGRFFARRNKSTIIICSPFRSKEIYIPAC